MQECVSLTAGRVTGADHLTGVVDAGGGAGRTAESAEVIGSGINRAVGRRSEGVDGTAGRVTVADHLTGVVDAGGRAECAEVVGERIDGTVRSRPEANARWGLSAAVASPGHLAGVVDATSRA